MEIFDTLPLIRASNDLSHVIILDADYSPLNFGTFQTLNERS